MKSRDDLGEEPINQNLFDQKLPMKRKILRYQLFEKTKILMRILFFYENFINQTEISALPGFIEQ